MDADSDRLRFSEDYGHHRARRAAEGAGETVPEHVLQCVWYDQLFEAEGLLTDAGMPVQVLSPGRWNRSEGPDFKCAQLRFGDTIKTGDVEIHFNHAAWKQHGHHLDNRYDDVLLIVTAEKLPPHTPPLTSQGRPVANLLLGQYLTDDLSALADSLPFEHYPEGSVMGEGQCAAVVRACGAGRLERLLDLAGDWRMVHKARLMRERMERVGVNQALYEAFLSACGYSRYKQHFRVVAQQFPYDRVRQLARRDALLVEAGMLHIAGLLPSALPEGTTAVPHFARLRALRRDELEGLRTLPLLWKRVGVRPTNYPERRLAGAARFIARTAETGLQDTLEGIWRQDLNPKARRQAFEALFPRPIGFWANHCCWTGKQLTKPLAPIGAARIHAIVGNVFLPAALATARSRRDRHLEEKVFAFFAAMPRESENHVFADMVPRLFGDAKPQLNFRRQQGLLQLYQDWCESNPSCRECSVLAMMQP